MKAVAESVILQETKLSITKAAIHAERSHGTISNWMDVGVVSRRNGKRIFLEWTQDGGQIITSKEAIARFQAEINEEG